MALAQRKCTSCRDSATQTGAEKGESASDEGQGVKLPKYHNNTKFITSHSLLGLKGQPPTPSASRKRTLEMRGDCTPPGPKKQQLCARPATKLPEGSPLVKACLP